MAEPDVLPPLAVSREDFALLKYFSQGGGSGGGRRKLGEANSEASNKVRCCRKLLALIGFDPMFKRR